MKDANLSAEPNLFSGVEEPTLETIDNKLDNLIMLMGRLTMKENSNIKVDAVRPKNVDLSLLTNILINGGLTYNEFKVLVVMMKAQSARGPKFKCYQSYLASVLHLKQLNQVTALTNSLQDMGYITKETDTKRCNGHYPVLYTVEWANIREKNEEFEAMNQAFREQKESSDKPKADVWDNLAEKATEIRYSREMQSVEE